MDTPILSSTFLLTFLLLIGLFFFIRASVKDRTQALMLTSEQPEESVLQQLQEYFAQRAYRVEAIDPEQKRVTFRGFVRPSLFLAVFLTLLAAVGLLCLALILSIAFPQSDRAPLGLVLLSPIAGLFYWKKAGRSEQVVLKIEPMATGVAEVQSAFTVTAHRDELIELQRTFAFKPAS